MASLSSEMIVDVEQYQAFAEAVKTESAKWESTWDAYLKQLNFVQDSGIEAGAAAKAFLEFADTVSKLNGAFEKFGEDVAQDITSFLKDVDEADSTLFKNEGNKVFTDEEFKKAYSVVDNTPQSFRIEDDTWIVILIEKLCKLFWKGYGQKVKIEDYESELVKRVQEVKMKTSEDLAQVKAGVRAADHTFQQYLAARQNELTELLALLKMIASILETPSGIISHGDLTAITCALSDLKKADVTVTDENVVSFSKSISNYFGPTTAEIRSYCESSVASLITTDFDNYRATVKAAKSYFDSYSQDYNETQKNIDKYKNMFDQILRLYQKYGAEKWAEHAQEAQITIQKEDVERFNRIVSKTAKLSKYSDDYMDIWLPMFCDMSASKEMFARFKANCDLDKPGVQKALERVEELYNQSEEAYISETLETLTKQIKDWATKKTAQTLVEVYADVYASFGGTIASGVARKIGNGIIEKAFAEAPAVQLLDWVEATNNSFNNAVMKLNGADPASDGYQELIQDVRLQFETAKEAQLSFYSELAKNASPKERERFKKIEDSIQSMSLLDVAPGEIYDYEDERYFLIDYIMDGDVTLE